MKRHYINHGIDSITTSATTTVAIFVVLIAVAGSLSMAKHPSEWTFDPCNDGISFSDFSDLFAVRIRISFEFSANQSSP